jgi:hypothetical protein
MQEKYRQELISKIGSVFQSHPSLFDHQKEFPWLTGALGDPESGIWFIAENPSLTQVERVSNPDGGAPTEEAQWWSSQGDKLFRDMLVAHGFKSGTIDSPDGWHCYITNVVKEADYSSHWHDKSQELRNQAAEIWSSVLAWELAISKPRLVVVFGGSADLLLKHLISVRRIQLPEIINIKHYSYIGQRAQGKLGPMHPERVKQYSKDFDRIKKKVDQLMSR